MQIRKLYVSLRHKLKQTQMKKAKQTVKILGQTVTVGTKEHAKLVYTLKLIKQNAEG